MTSNLINERVRQATQAARSAGALCLLSVVIPARDEEGCIASTVEHLYVELRLREIPHEIVVVDDGSTDGTWKAIEEVRERIPTLVPVHNSGLNGFGRAVVYGLDRCKGDAIVIMMADESDDCRDVVTYWKALNEGYDCVFGSRFVKGGGTIDYPYLKLKINRLANFFLRMLFRIHLNDTTNAFKAYRRTVIDGCRPFLSPHFNLTIEIPLKAIVRGYTWKVVPITWRNRRTGAPKLRIKEMGSRYLFICMYVWLEKYFSKGDYKRVVNSALERADSTGERAETASRPPKRVAHL
jgi:dolichol-phosphate mannosyltransferase